MSNLPEQQVGRYQLQALLGRGGMADVYRAHDPQLDRDVAVKLIHPQFAEEEGFAERFSHEARAVARLRHPNIIQVFDFDLANGRPYMVMELAGGATLKDRLKAARDSGAPLPISEVLRIATAIGSALDYAHTQGMTHRDIKPSNILFTATGDPLLSRFWAGANHRPEHAHGGWLGQRHARLYVAGASARPRRTGQRPLLVRGRGL